MQLFLRTYLVILFLVIYLNPAAAQKTIEQDSSHIEANHFKEGFKDAYSGSDFNYAVNDTDGINLLQRMLRGFFNWLGDLFGFDISPEGYKILEYIIYAIFGVVVLYLLIKFLLQSPINTVFKTEQKNIDGFNYIEEDIEQINFDKLIKNALKDKNYRLATRYLYLKSLKTLSNKNIIEWHFDKTNSDYINEIKDHKLKSLFKRASYIYDYVWYGEFPINEDHYKRNSEDFTKLITSSN